MPASYARELLASNQAKLVGWYSELDEIQFGALFASSKMIATRRAAIEKFVRAYRRGWGTIRRLCYVRTAIPSVPPISSRTRRRRLSPGMSIPIAEPAAQSPSRQAPTSIDPQAQLDIADIERQIAWYVHGQIDKTVSARDVVDPSFVK